MILPVPAALLTFLTSCPILTFKGRLNVFCQITQNSVQWMNPTLQISSEHLYCQYFFHVAHTCKFAIAGGTTVQYHNLYHILNIWSSQVVNIQVLMFLLSFPWALVHCILCTTNTMITVSIVIKIQHYWGIHKNTLKSVSDVIYKCLAKLLLLGKKDLLSFLKKERLMITAVGKFSSEPKCSLLAHTSNVSSVVKFSKWKKKYAN